MLNDQEVWLELYKVVYQNNHSKLSYYDMAREADHLLREFRNRFPTAIFTKDKPVGPANQTITWANVSKQTPDTRY